VRQQFLLDLGHSPTPGCRDHSKTDFFNGIGQNRKRADFKHGLPLSAETGRSSPAI